MSSPNEIAKAKVTLEADMKPLKEDLSGVKTELDGVGKKADEVSDSATKSFSKMGAGFEKVQSIMGKALIPVAVFSSLVSVRNMIKASREEAEAFKNNIGEVSKAISDLRKGLLLEKSDFSPELQSVNEIYRASQDAQKEVNRLLDEELDKREEMRTLSTIIAFGREKASGKSNEQLALDAEEQILKIQKSTNDAIQIRIDLNRKASQEAVEQAKKNAKETADAFIAQLGSINDGSAIDLLPPEQQISARAKFMSNELTKAAEEAGVAFEDAALQQALSNIDAKAQREIEALRELDREKDRLDKERADKELARQVDNAKKLAEVFAREMQAATDGLFGSSSQFTTNIGSLISEVKRLRNEMGNLK